MLTWKSLRTSGVMSVLESEITFSLIESACVISEANELSSSMQTLMYRWLSDSAIRAISDSFLLAILEAASDADQKFTVRYLPLSESGETEVREESVSEGASFPNSREWLPVGIDDERKAVAKANDKIKKLVFTITCFRYTIAIATSFLMPER